jgi:hypothetical protein
MPRILIAEAWTAAEYASCASVTIGGFALYFREAFLWMVEGFAKLSKERMRFVQCQPQKELYQSRRPAKLGVLSFLLRYGIFECSL